MNMLKSLRAALGFLSIIPVGMDRVEDVARASWTFPVVGAIIGVLASLIAFIFAYFFSWDIVALAALASLYIFSGFHHLDGLLDWADALFVRGSIEKKLGAMHDLNHGVSAFGTGFFVLLAGFLSIKHSSGLLIQLVVAESTAKFSMVLACYISKGTSHSGTGTIFFSNIKGNQPLLFKTFLVYLPFLALALFRAPYVLLDAAIITFLIVRNAEKSFGGISGDILGAVNEIVRTATLMVLL